MNKKHSVLWVALFFAVLTIVGLLTSADYGQSLDGPSEQVILQENLKEYAVLLLGEDSAAVQGYDALGIDRITESIEMDHGQAVYYPAAPLLQLRENHPQLFNTLWHVYTWLWFMVGLLAVYSLCRSLGLSRVLACAAVLLLYLSPRFFAEGHYNNKDIILMSLVLWTLAAGVRFMNKPDLQSALLFGLAGALAANTRIIGFFAFGVVGIVTIIKLLVRREMTRQALLRGVVAVSGFIVVYLLTTPAFCVNPPAFITHIVANTTAFTRWTGVVIYKGFTYDPAGGLLLPRSYLPTMIALTTPVAVLVLTALGGFYALFLCIRNREYRPALIAVLLIGVIPLLYAMLAQPILYNGWRHFYFLYGPMIVLAGLGLSLLSKLLKKRRTWTIAGAAVLSLLLIWQGVGIALNHPYQYAYYNVLAGDVEGRFELDYWEVSTLNAMALLIENGERDTGLPLVLGGGDHMSWFSLNQCDALLTEEQRGELTVAEEEDTDTPYIFSNTTYAQIYSMAPPENYQVLFAIESYGQVIAVVYERIE